MLSFLFSLSWPLYFCESGLVILRVTEIAPRHSFPPELENRELFIEKDHKEHSRMSWSRAAILRNVPHFGHSAITKTVAELLALQPLKYDNRVQKRFLDRKDFEEFVVKPLASQVQDRFGWQAKDRGASPRRIHSRELDPA
jgi:hypothetical protein